MCVCASVCVHAADSHDSIDGPRQRPSRRPHLDPSARRDMFPRSHALNEAAASSGGDSNISETWLRRCDCDVYKNDVVFVARSVGFF